MIWRRRTSVRCETPRSRGHQLLGAFYSNKKYTSVDQRIGFVIDNQALAKHDGTWAVYYNFDQYVYEPKKGADQGIGLFGRFGASQGDPNPAQYFYSAGVGGKGLFPSRTFDQFGLGYYCVSVRNPTFQRPTFTQSFLRDEWGFEGHYDLALTPWLLLTPDVQVIGPSQKQQLVAFRRASARRQFSACDCRWCFNAAQIEKTSAIRPKNFKIDIKKMVRDTLV